MDIWRLAGLICVSETMAYAQVNRFREQINPLLRMKTITNTLKQMKGLTKRQYCVWNWQHSSLLQKRKKESFPFQTLRERSYPSEPNPPQQPLPSHLLTKIGLAKTHACLKCWALPVPCMLCTIHTSSLVLGAFTQSSDFSHQYSQESRGCLNKAWPAVCARKCLYVPGIYDF